MKKLLYLLLLCPLAHGQLWSGILQPVGTSPCSGSVPAHCGLADWANAGIPGGIPTATQAGSTITSTGSDQTSTIAAALNACGASSGANKYVNLAAGTFIVAGIINLNAANGNNYCRLNGQGANQTIIHCTGTSGNGCIVLGSANNVYPSTSNDTTITGGLSAGSTSITVASASHISLGSLLSISELNSLNNNVNSTGSEGFCNFCDNYNGFQSSGQTVLVTGVSGTTITISPGLYWQYGTTLPSWTASHIYYAGTSVTSGGNIWQETASPSSTFTCTSGSSGPSSSDGTCVWTMKGSGTTTSPVATPFTPVAIGVGIQNLQVYTVNAGTSTLVGPNVIINQCEYCFVHGSEANYTDADFIYANYDYGGIIDQDYFSNAILHTSGTYDSCVQLSGKSSRMLVQANIIERSHQAVIIEGGATGNVIGYNYMPGGFDTGASEFVIGGIDFHGASPQYNLMEGNVLPLIYPDSVWGTSANNTEFRNWSQGSAAVDYPIAAGRNTVSGGSTVVCGSIAANKTCFPFQASRAMQISYLSLGNNLVGNVVGSSQQSSNLGYGSGVTTYNSGATVTDALQWPTTRIYDSTVYAYSFGYGESADDGTWPLDSATSFTSALIHGNYGNISNAIVWSGSITHTLPASFYLSSEPSWWGSLSYPSIGPDVTGLSGPGGHVSLTAGNPAMACYLGTMGGTPGGAGSPLSFNASNCYASTLPPSSGSPVLLLMSQ